MTICVFGSARDEIGPEYLAFGEAVGRAIAARGCGVLFGGGARGMMGAAARGAHEGGAEILGVAPRFFDKPGIFSPYCTDFILTDTMAERKSIMEERADAFIALPGGVGTFEEIFEVITLRSLDQTDKPIALLDCRDFWREAHEKLLALSETGFASKALPGLYGYFTDIEKCLDYILA